MTSNHDERPEVSGSLRNMLEGGMWDWMMVARGGSEGVGVAVAINELGAG